MGYKRPVYYEGNIQFKSKAGDGFFSMPGLTSIATDAAATLTTAQVLGGMIQFTGFTAGRNITTPTAADFLAALPEMDIGDTFLAHVSITTAFAGTWVAGAGVTLAGRATTPASTHTFVLIEKLSDTTIRWTVI